ncbi:MAG: hypothetical protein QOE93_1068 [Actinomycetota bacterium]|jgi:hypothetical protein|nr:hypothetical protein [Actinomycetota bacterium]
MRKIVNRRIRHEGKDGSVVADVQAVVSTNTGASAQVTAESGGQKVRIVQHNGHTEVTEG